MTDQSQAEFPRFPGSSSNTNGINEYEAYGSEEYYSHQPPHDHLYLPPPIVMKQPMMVPQKSMISNLFSTDFIKILLLLILKLLLIKLKTIGFIKIVLLILLKLPVIFFGIIFKLLLFVKITNLFKLLTLPLFLPLILIILAPILLLLLPLLLIPFAPLLLIPLLLPLLLFLPIPVLTVTTTTTTTTTTAAPSGKRRRRRFISNEYNNNNNNLPYEYSDSRNNELLFFRNLIESEKCLERIACKLAADRRSTLFNSYILRILDFAKEYLINPRLYSYAHAYRSGVSSDSTFATCTNKYPCSRLKS
ncbi:uncharacterized protein LOC142330452 [Lycorma delicatula]|uniref:uncharacterized protein LOC142330452 n=1 Tax=Lycorma delicatula TaxID=130591 RepID=UPI003F517338